MKIKALLNAVFGIAAEIGYALVIILSALAASFLLSCKR